ncbi:hypothetical protein BLNAU_22249 [Blattamonas nauphoetae]|uniref:AIG1-type G domain-containing protein n=1 Tax=Blattamonas nauphoetae TaxID=2049346 RepID=A0ABQ9WTK6_9EUKA|nr:hypothetical protein BLNAU_22245 [Blattamonas nauphoetae]KAK2942835.1 hypothetical protein BLNAU_22249 [Blattamonas nauphoetae]
MVGGSGAGKTTFCIKCGAPASFRCGVHRLRPITDAPQSAQLIRNGHPFEIIDTQGTSITVTEDRAALEQTTHFLEKVPGVNLICYVVKITDNRATEAMRNTLRYIRNMFGRADVWSHMCVVVTHSERQSAIFSDYHEIFLTEFKRGLEDLIDAEFENERTDPIRLFFVDSKVGQMDPETESELDQLVEFAASLNPMPTTSLTVPDPLIRKVTHYEETNIVSEQTVQRYIQVTHAHGAVTSEPDGEVKTTVTETQFLTKREFYDPPDPAQPDQYCIVSEEREPEYSTKEEIIGATMLGKKFCMKRNDQYLRKWTQITWLDGTTSTRDVEEECLFQPQYVNDASSKEETLMDTVTKVLRLGGAFQEFIRPIAQLMADALSDDEDLE